MATVRFPVVLMGVGKVGRAVLDRLATAQSLFTERFKLAFDVKAICDSTGCVIATDGQSHVDVQEVLDWKESQPLHTHRFGHKAPLESIRKLHSSRSILVDCSATHETTPTLRWWIEQGGNVVTANKKPLTGNMEDFKSFTSPDHHARFGYESTCGAGTPFIASLLRLEMAGDVVRSIQGSFSGTLGFVTSGFDDGRKFSELVLDAHAKGLTEPDPRDDLNGMDVARKALILARTIGWDRTMADVTVEPLFPAALANVSLDEFMASLTSIDDEYARRFAEASDQGCVLRYVATIKDGKCDVGLKAVPLSSAVGRLQGTDNIMQLESDVYYKQPLVIQGSGAGPGVTASGVVGDMVNIALKHF